jgi:hypothetical protein
MINERQYRDALRRIFVPSAASLAKILSGSIFVEWSYGRGAML